MAGTLLTGSNHSIVSSNDNRHMFKNTFVPVGPILLAFCVLALIFCGAMVLNLFELLKDNEKESLNSPRRHGRYKLSSFAILRPDKSHGLPAGQLEFVGAEV